MESPRDASDPIGRLIAGRFEVIRPLAGGAMGQVYLARQRPLERDVALKVLDVRGGQASADFHARFSREASVLARLEHPNTVRVFDHGRDGAICYLAMEYLDGPTLDEVIRKEGRLEPLRALQIVRSIAAALEEAHQLGVIHRDLKPSNVILVTRQGRETPKVVDFGLVKLADVDATQPGMVLGTPNYMAPEQINGSRVDRRADIYALGVLLFVLLTGEKPFDTTSRSEVLAAHLSRAPRALSEAAPDLTLPRSFGWTVARCLEKHPDDRFATMLDLARALNACEIAARHVELAALQPGLDHGRTLLPPQLVRHDAGFQGPRPVDVRAVLAASRGAAPARAIAVGALGLIAATALVGTVAIVGWAAVQVRASGAGQATGPAPAPAAAAEIRVEPEVPAFVAEPATPAPPRPGANALAPQPSAPAGGGPVHPALGRER